MPCASLVAYACNSSTQDAGAGGCYAMSLNPDCAVTKVPGQAGLHRQDLGRGEGVGGVGGWGGRRGMLCNYVLSGSIV